MGRLCEWKLPKEVSSEDFETFEEFQESLELKCERGKPGRLTFKPDKDTPDLLYYQCFTHRYLGWKIHVVDSCDDRGLHHEASVQHIRNITYNTFESDYKRGGEKKKLSSSEEDTDEKHSLKYFGGNDGIPLDISEVNDAGKKDDKHVSGDDSETQKNLYYKPSSSVYFSSPQHYYSTSIPSSSELYYKPKTSEHKKYFYTTPESKSHYYQTSTTRTPSSRKYSIDSTIKFNTPTMEPFRIRDVIHSGAHRGTYHVKSTTTKPSTQFRTLVLNQGQTAPVKFRVYVSTQKPPVLPTQAPYSGSTRSQSQWWNQPNTNSNNRNKAPSSVKTQLSFVQAVKQDQGQRIPQSSGGVHPAHVHYERSFIPVVLKNNGSFDTIVARAPLHHSHPHGSPPGHLLALTATTHNGKSIVPVLVRAKEPVRRTIGDSSRGGIQTPLGKLPYPNTSSRNRAPGDKSAQPSGESYLPLLVPHNKNTTSKAASTNKKRVAPLIPLVVPEKKDDNLYILHQMLSLLNENPQSIAARGIKIIGSSNDKNIRTRVVRSADDHHHHNHDSHDHASHEHEDHDHDHGHDRHHTHRAGKSSGQLFAISTYLLAAVLIYSLRNAYKLERF